MERSIDGETIHNAIAKKIRECFQKIQDNHVIYPVIYEENMPEIVEKPCFFLRTVKVIQSKKGKNRYIRTYYMEIQYHASFEELSVEEGKEYKQLCTIGHVLMEGLKEIQVLYPLRGKDMAYRIEKGILHFYITYPLGGYFAKLPFAKQGELELREYIKGEEDNGRWKLDSAK